MGGNLNEIDMEIIEANPIVYSIGNMVLSNINEVKEPRIAPIVKPRKALRDMTLPVRRLNIPKSKALLLCQQTAFIMNVNVSAATVIAKLGRSKKIQ